MTRDEAKAKCEEIWRSKNSWDLSYWDFVKLSKKDDIDLIPEEAKYYKQRDGDTVYRREECGRELTRMMANNWAAQWSPFLHGFMTAWELLQPAETDREHVSRVQKRVDIKHG